MKAIRTGLVALIATAVSTLAMADVAYTFDADTQGFTLVGDGTLAHVAGGGNGHLSVTDTNGNTYTNTYSNKNTYSYKYAYANVINNTFGDSNSYTYTYATTHGMNVDAGPAARLASHEFNRDNPLHPSNMGKPGIMIEAPNGEEDCFS